MIKNNILIFVVLLITSTMSYAMSIDDAAAIKRAARAQAIENVIERAISQMAIDKAEWQAKREEKKVEQTRLQKIANAKRHVEEAVQKHYNTMAATILSGKTVPNELREIIIDHVCDEAGTRAEKERIERKEEIAKKIDSLNETTRRWKSNLPGTGGDLTEEYKTLGDFPLYLAAKHKRTDWIIALLNAGEHPLDSKYQQLSPLLKAIDMLYVEGVETLLASARYDVSYRTKALEYLQRNSSNGALVPTEKRASYDIIVTLLTVGQQPRLLPNNRFKGHISKW